MTVRTRNVWWLAGWPILVVTLVAGCASGGATGAGLTAGATDTGAPPSVSAAASGIPLRGLTHLAGGDAGGLTSMPWILLSRSSGGGLEIAYVEGDGTCVEPRGVVLQETPDALVVGVMSATDSSRAACADRLVLGRSEVALSASQARLRLVHAVVDHAWLGADYFATIE